jgi:hypothetical protein
MSMSGLIHYDFDKCYWRCIHRQLSMPDVSITVYDVLQSFNILLNVMKGMVLLDS